MTESTDKKPRVSVPDEHLFDVQDSLPYLVARAGALTEASFKPSLGQYDLSIEMWRVLATLATRGPMSLRRLAAETSIVPSTLSRLAERMVRRRLVSRVPSVSDQRAVEVSIRPEGYRLVSKLTPEAERIQGLMMEAFRGAELPLLRDFLRRLYGVVTEINRGTVPERRAPSRPAAVPAPETVPGD